MTRSRVGLDLSTTQYSSISDMLWYHVAATSSARGCGQKVEHTGTHPKAAQAQAARTKDPSNCQSSILSFVIPLSRTSGLPSHPMISARINEVELKVLYSSLFSHSDTSTLVTVTVPHPNLLRPTFVYCRVISAQALGAIRTIASSPQARAVTTLKSGCEVSRQPSRLLASHYSALLINKSTPYRRKHDLLT
jgi:hypothetical protein